MWGKGGGKEGEREIEEINLKCIGKVKKRRKGEME